MAGHTSESLVDDGAFLAHEHQAHLADVLGEHSWGVDFTAGTIRFEGERPLTATVHLLGSQATAPPSWLWGWANPSGFDEQVVALGRRVSEAGRADGIAVLADAETGIDAGGDGDRISVAAKVLGDCWWSYRGTAGGGTTVFMLLESPELVLPPPSAIRTTRVLMETVASIAVHDQRRAIHSYAVRRGVPMRWIGDDEAAAFDLPDGSFEVRFDDQARIAEITGTMGQG